MKTRVALFALAALFALIGVSIWATGISPSRPRSWASREPGRRSLVHRHAVRRLLRFPLVLAWVAFKETSWIARLSTLPADHRSSQSRIGQRRMISRHVLRRAIQLVSLKATQSQNQRKAK